MQIKASYKFNTPALYGKFASMEEKNALVGSVGFLQMTSPELIKFKDKPTVYVAVANSIAAEEIAGRDWADKVKEVDTTSNDDEIKALEAKLEATERDLAQVSETNKELQEQLDKCENPYPAPPDESVWHRIMEWFRNIFNKK